jgi:hypothetical protein
VESLVDAPHEKAQRRERWKANAVRVSDLCQLPSIDREMEAMSDAKLSSKTLSIPDGELWSLVRSLISQGTYIQMDATAGKYKHSEEFFARIDEAARERAEEILTKYSAPEPCAGWRAWAQHLEQCTDCHVGDMCDEGRALKAVENGADSPKAPWLTTAHLLCTDAGIPQGHINDRLLALRQKLERPAPPPSAVLVNAFRAGAFYGCAEEFNPLDLQRDAEAYGSRHSPTKGAAQ